MIFTMTYIGWENYNNIASIQKTQFFSEGVGSKWLKSVPLLLNQRLESSFGTGKKASGFLSSSYLIVRTLASTASQFQSTARKVEKRVKKKTETNNQMEVNNDVEKQDEAILFSLLHKNILGQLREEGN